MRGGEVISVEKAMTGALQWCSGTYVRNTFFFIVVNYL